MQEVLPGVPLPLIEMSMGPLKLGLAQPLKFQAEATETPAVRMAKTVVSCILSGVVGWSRMSVLHIHGIARECGPERLTEVKAFFAEEIICLRIFELGCCEDGGLELGGYSGWYLYSRAHIKHRAGFRLLRTMHSYQWIPRVNT